MNYSGIYYVKIAGSKYIYVGQFVDLGSRIGNHLYKLRANRHENNHLQNAYNKYGVGSLVYGVLEKCIPDVLTRQEQKWIDFFGFDNLYNMCPVAEGCRGRVMSEDHKAKIGKSAAGFGGKKHSEKSKRKISESLKGRVFSREHIERTAEINERSILCIDKRTNVMICRYDSLRKAC